ncbi:MAG: Ku protein [Acidobacteriaceae bacterium]|nr:Ku protein [Acidobacteriaceae bacterium]
MARPYWSGQIQISLVSFGVHLFVATESRSELHFHQIDRHTGERVRHQKVLASALEGSADEADDPVERSQIVKGYEYAKGQYLQIEPEEIAQLRVPSRHTMEITQFVDAASINPAYYEKPYFVVPSADTQTEAFLTVRKAMLDTAKIGLSRIAFGGREHLVALAPAGEQSTGGIMAYTLRYASELRNPQAYFSEIKKQSLEQDSLALAKELIQRKSASFRPETFIDGYETALKELVDAKLKHQPLPKETAPKRPQGKVISLMDALRHSMATEADATSSSTPARKRSAGLKLVKNAAKSSETKSSAKTAATKTAKSSSSKSGKRKSA